MCARGLCSEHEQVQTSDTQSNTIERPVTDPLKWSKNDSVLRDPQSTGRKRAARLYPLDRTANCEWSLKDNCGGGNVSIEGCGIRKDSKGNVTPIGLQENIHHGPDYSTLNNSPENVNRICSSCHNYWHAQNDPYKDIYYLKKYGHAASNPNQRARLGRNVNNQ